jgi:hypothetical protein
MKYIFMRKHEILFYEKTLNTFSRENIIYIFMGKHEIYINE